jgi:hypothetical protein
MKKTDLNSRDNHIFGFQKCLHVIYYSFQSEIYKKELLVKVEVTVELDVNLSKAGIEDIKKLLEEMMNPRKFDALEAISIKDIKIGI